MTNSSATGSNSTTSMLDEKRKSKKEKASTKTRQRKKVKGIEDGWFSEVEAMWPGQRFSLALDQFSEEQSVLFSGKSDFQSILVFKSAQYGHVLALDGVIQLTERDEFAFHEAMAHVPLFSHTHPANVLIVGGGDGGLLREVCRHSCVESITLVEIDPMVIEVCRKFFADSTATNFDDPRVTIVNDDAAEYLRKTNESTEDNKSVTKKKFDIIFCDSSDPSGPAESIFQPRFFEHMREILNDEGIICAQGECIWIHLDLIADIMACCGDLFDHVEYASTMVPTYPCGQIGFVLAGKGRSSCKTAVRSPSLDLQKQLKWYNPAMHSAAFVLPQFVVEKLGSFGSANDLGLTDRALLRASSEADNSDGNDGEVDCFLDRLRCSIS